MIYGLCGNLGSGKTSLMKVLSGHEVQSKGDLLYQGSPFKKGLFGDIKREKEIYYINANMLDSNSSTGNFIKKTFPSKYNENRIDDWDGVCDNGKLISSGIYFIVASNKNTTSIGKLAVIH